MNLRASSGLVGLVDGLIGWQQNDGYGQDTTLLCVTYP